MFTVALNNLTDVSNLMAAPSNVAPGQHVSLRALLATLLRPALLPHVALLVLSAIGGLMLIRIDPNAWGTPPHGLVALVHLIGFAWYLGLGYVRETGRLNRILLSDRRDAIALVRIFATMLAVISATTGLVLLAGRYLFGPERAWVEACAWIIGSMFILWSLTQASALRTTIVETVAPRCSGPTPAGRESAPWVRILVVQAFVGSIGWTLTRPHEAHVTRIVVLVLFHAFMLGLHLMLERRAGSLEAPPTKGAHRFLTSWTIVLVSMIAWHVLTALRHLVLTPEEQGLGLLVLSEEVILMIVTILAAIWNLSSKTRTLVGLVVTPIRAVVWGLAFAWGYIGSIVVLTTLFEDPRTVLACGHLVTAVALTSLHRMGLSEGFSIISEELELRHTAHDGQHTNSGPESG